MPNNNLSKGLLRYWMRYNRRRSTHPNGSHFCFAVTFATWQTRAYSMLGTGEKCKDHEHQL